jgi:hypothetical protein
VALVAHQYYICDAVSVVTMMQGQAISSPDMMVAALQGTPHSIGFVQNTWGDSQQGGESGEFYCLP